MTLLQGVFFIAAMGFFLAGIHSYLASRAETMISLFAARADAVSARCHDIAERMYKSMAQYKDIMDRMSAEADAENSAGYAASLDDLARIGDTWNELRHETGTVERELCHISKQLRILRWSILDLDPICEDVEDLLDLAADLEGALRRNEKELRCAIKHLGKRSSAG